MIRLPFCILVSLVAVPALSAVASADERPAPDKPETIVKAARSKPTKKKSVVSTIPAEEKVAPTTDVAAPQPPEAAPIALVPPPPPAAPASPAPVTPPPDRVEPAAAGSSDHATRIEAVVGRTQSFGFAVGLRAGHRMASNVYVGGSAITQTGIDGAIVSYGSMELGYDAQLGDARFMPYVGVGPMFVIPTEGDGKVLVTPVVYPGFAFHYENDKSPLVAGADVRFIYLTEHDAAAVALNLTVGVRF